MSIILKSNRAQYDEVIGLPCYRICATVEGGFESLDTHAAAVAIHDAFVARFGSDIHFGLRASKSNRTVNVAKATPKKTAAIREALQTGIDGDLKKLAGVRLFGTDKNPFNAPFMPSLSLMINGWAKLVDVEITIPWDIPDLRVFADDLHGILCQTRVRFGYQGMGFGKGRIDTLSDQYFPLAYRRFRTAIMGEFNPRSESTLFRTDYIVEKFGDYQPGILDTGWRTYVGNDYRDRLGNADVARRKSVEIDEQAQFTIVTAGPEPIWGDVNADEDVSSFTAAYEYLRPAYADMKRLSKSLWGDHSPAEKAASAGYYTRLAKEVSV